MTDVVLVQFGKAHEIFPNMTLSQMQSRFHPSLVAQMVEVPTGTVEQHYLWDGENFTPPE